MPKSPATAPIKSLGLVYGHDPAAWYLYRRQIDSELSDRFGSQFLPRLVANVLHADAIENAIVSSKWREVERLAIFAAQQAVAGGAEGIMLCSGALHVVADAVRAKVQVPLLHMAEATVSGLSLHASKRVGLLGTRSVDEEKLWQERCAEQGIHASVLEPKARSRVTEIIRDRLGRGLGGDAERHELFRLAAEFHRQGVSMVVLVAPELQLALDRDNTPFPITDAMTLQVSRAITWATGMTLPGFPPAPPCEAAA